MMLSDDHAAALPISQMCSEGNGALVARSHCLQSMHCRFIIQTTGMSEACAYSVAMPRQSQYQETMDNIHQLSMQQT